MFRSVLAKDNQEISQELLSLGVIQHLLHAMANREHIDSQVQASLALQVPIPDTVQACLLQSINEEPMFHGIF